MTKYNSVMKTYFLLKGSTTVQSANVCLHTPDERKFKTFELLHTTIEWKCTTVRWQKTRMQWNCNDKKQFLLFSLNCKWCDSMQSCKENLQLFNDSIQLWNSYILLKGNIHLLLFRLWAILWLHTAVGEQKMRVCSCNKGKSVSTFSFMI